MGVVLEPDGGGMYLAKCSRGGDSRLLVEWDGEKSGAKSMELVHASTVVMSSGHKVDVWSAAGRCNAVFPYRTPQWLGSTLFRGCVALTAHDGGGLDVEVVDRHYDDVNPPLPTAARVRGGLASTRPRAWSRSDIVRLGQGGLGIVPPSTSHIADVSTMSSRSADSSTEVDDEEESASMASDVERDALYDDDVDSGSATESDAETELADEDGIEEDDTPSQMLGL